MKRLAQAFALASLLPVCALQAQTGTLSCTPSSNGSSLTIPIFSVYLSVTDSLATAFFTVTAPLSELNLLEFDFFYSNTFSSCSFSPTTGTSLFSVTLRSVTASADAAQQYASATFAYSGILIGPTGDKIAMRPPATPMTAAEQQKALADYLLTVPKPALTATPAK